MEQIRKEHRAVRVLVAARRIPTIALLLTIGEAKSQFVVTRTEIRDLLGTGELRAVRIDGRLWLPVWRLERLFPRR